MKQETSFILKPCHLFLWGTSTGQSVAIQTITHSSHDANDLADRFLVVRRKWRENGTCVAQRFINQSRTRSSIPKLFGAEVDDFCTR